ncbi:hypothetical protein [Bdellovibrio sp. HCB337]|uniref:hypothetical protein n=1 Tax=Bdellovibrio sp. HCB337 TaxID=3394358 RepID=UPI0039A505D8
MKLVIAVLCLLSISWSVQAAPLPENIDLSNEVVESILEKTEVSEDSSKTIIRVSDKVSFTLDSEPDPEAMKEALGMKMPEKLRQQLQQQGLAEPEERNPLEAYLALPSADQQRFKEIRVIFLTGAARVLRSSKFLLGAGSLVGDAFKFVKSKIRHPLTALEPKEHVGFNERSERAALAILKGIDYKLWYQAPLVIDSNEFGVSISVGVVAETGILKKGVGGAEELGFSLAFSKSKKAFVFELFHNSEKFDNTKAAVSVIGIVGKAEMMMAHRSGADTLKGSSFYPPAVPGHSAASADYFAAGASSSFGLPPPPLADLLTFTNKFERRTWLRVVVSPVVKGFVRLEIGDIPGSIRVVKAKFVDAYANITHLIGSRRAGTCEFIFTH